MTKEMIPIKTEYIRLDDLLKIGGAVGTGGHAKVVIQDGQVLLNGVVCEQRGKKLRAGDTVQYDNCLYEVCGEN